MARATFFALLFAALCFSALSLPAAAEGGEDLSGVWRIEIVGGPSEGDHGEIEMSPLGPAEAGALRTKLGLDATLAGAGMRYYRGLMRFTDSRADVTAKEECLIAALGEAATVRCHTTQPGWLPDDFDLKRTAPGEMRGPHISAVSGEALFRRLGDPEPVS